MTSTIKPPTDAEINELSEAYLLRMFGSRVVFNGTMIDFARAVLARWGAPSPAGEPVAWGIFDSKGFYEAAIDQESAERFCVHYNKRKGADPLKPYTCAPLYTAPPTQPEAVREPQQYRLLEARVDRIEASDEFLQDDAQTWAADPHGIFVGALYGGALRAARRRITQKEGGRHAE